MNRALYQVHDAVDTAVVRPVAQAYVDVVPLADPHGRFERLQQHRRPLLGGQRPPAGQARQGRRRFRPRGAQHRVRPRRDLRSRVDDRHRARQRGLRPDVRRLGLPAGSVPVRAAVRADDGARRHRPGRALRRGVRSATSTTRRCAGASTASATSTSARRRSMRAASSTRRRSTATPSSATPICSGAAILSTTASRRPNPRRT